MSSNKMDFKTHGENERFREFLDYKQTSESWTDPEAPLPDELRGLNIGAFTLTFIWGSAMRVYVSWLCMVPFIGMVMPFVLLVKGNEWAWQNRRWQSIEHFKRVQAHWAYAGIASLLLMVVVSYFTFSFVHRQFYMLMMR